MAYRLPSRFCSALVLGLLALMVATPISAQDCSAVDCANPNPSLGWRTLEACCGEAPQPTQTVFYYVLWTIGPQVQVDGTYIGESSQSSLQNQQDCLDYVRSLAPRGAQITRISCTPQ